MRGWVWDASAVHDVITGKSHYAAALLASAATRGQVVAIPAPALAAGLAQIPDPRARRAGLDALLEVPSVVVLPMDPADAGPAADLIAPFPPSVQSVTTATVALAARRRGWPVLTAHGDPVRALDSTLDVRELP